MERTGQTKVPRYAKEAFGFRAVVQRSQEFQRIAALPRRQWQTEPWLSNVVEIINDALRLPAAELGLWPIQCAALHDAVVEGGAFLPIGVGQGKAFISILAPVAMDAERPVLFVPADLRDQTREHVLPLMRKHFRLHPRLRVIGYSELSLAKNAEMLEDLKPDLIVLDEVHSVKNKGAGRTRRLVRYFREHPETKCVAMSGTVSNRSIKDFAHIAEWCLKTRSPVPRAWQELSDWADAIDEGVDEDKRVAPGALEAFCHENENVRQGFRRRLVETPGVVASAEHDLGVSLRVRRYLIEVPAAVREALSKLRNTWETPNGDIVTEAVDLWRHAREIALGFWYRWEPPAPRDWMNARREWKAYVREKLKHSKTLDTELQVWNDCERMQEAPDEWHAWVKVRDSFKPNSIAEWIDDFALRACAEWIRDGGIVWTSHRAFGERLAKPRFSQGLYSYFGAGTSKELLDYNLSRVALSISSHGQGKNLERYSRNLIVAPPSSGKTWEQVIGRTHREGQEADEVEVDVFLHAPELEDSFAQARADAVYLEDALGNRQKLNYADVVV